MELVAGWTKILVSPSGSNMNSTCHRCTSLDSIEALEKLPEPHVQTKSLRCFFV